MATAVKTYLAHVMPGRARLKVPERRGDGAFFDKVASLLRQCRGVGEVAVKPATGSIVVHFSGPFEALAAEALRNGLAASLDLQPSMPRAFDRARREVARLNERVADATGGESDLATVAFFALLAFSGVQLVRGRLLAPAATLLWYAADAAGAWRPGAARPTDPS